MLTVRARVTKAGEHAIAIIAENQGGKFIFDKTFSAFLYISWKYIFFE